MGKPVNMSPEEYARQIIADQQAYIKFLESQGGENTTTDRYEYSFSANINEPPSGNQMRLDSSLSSASKMWIHKLTNTGTDIMNAFTNYHAGDRVYVQDKNESSSYGRYTLAADPIFNADYIELPLTFVEAGAELNGGQPAILAMTRTL